MDNGTCKSSSFLTFFKLSPPLSEEFEVTLRTFLRSGGLECLLEINPHKGNYELAIIISRSSAYICRYLTTIPKLKGAVDEILKCDYSNESY